MIFCSSVMQLSQRIKADWAVRGVLLTRYRRQRWFGIGGHDLMFQNNASVVLYGNWVTLVTNPTADLTPGSNDCY